VIKKAFQQFVLPEFRTNRPAFSKLTIASKKPKIDQLKFYYSKINKPRFQLFEIELFLLL